MGASTEPLAGFVEKIVPMVVKRIERDVNLAVPFKLGIPRHFCGDDPIWLRVKGFHLDGNTG